MTMSSIPRAIVRSALCGVLLVAMVSRPAASARPVGGVGQDSPRDQAVGRHVRALEGANSGSAADVRARLEREHFSAGYLARTTTADREATVAALRAAAADVGDVRVTERNDRYVLVLGGRTAHEVTFAVEPAPPFGIDAIDVARLEPAPADAPIDLTPRNLAATVDRLEQEGWSGVVSVTLDGVVALERPFGQANRELGLPVHLDTVFGTGSRPIDYTIASILLLEQRGQLSRSDTIDRFFDGVPADKQTMTIEHLLSGQSGLPDFFHTADDWDPDLAWIDRDTAERRLLSQPLRFAPGTARVHSHAAFGLLAAVVERVSGQSYQQFVREHLFDPAGLTRTGFYGDARGLAVGAFAVGGGPGVVGVPNIPPNWGPTSWLVMGSGGMYSTVPDLQRFYAFLRSGGLLDTSRAARFSSGFVTRDGSDRGFELFHVYNPPGNEAILMLNMASGDRRIDRVIDALVRLVMPGARRN